MTFTSPVVGAAWNLKWLSRPVSYVSFDVEGGHDVVLYFDMTGEWCVDQPREMITWERKNFGDLVALKMGSSEQKILGKVRGGYGCLLW